MRTKKTVVILFSGKAGSGKTTAASILLEKLGQYPDLRLFQYSFANPIKHLCQTYIGWDKNKDDKGRRLLQNIGTVGREYDIDVWVKWFLIAMDKSAQILPFSFALIDDWRFENESEFLKKNPFLDVVTLRMYGRQSELSEKAGNDASENSLPEDVNSTLYSYTVNNSGSVEELSKELENVLAELINMYVVE